MMADYSCDRLRTVILNSTAVLPRSTMVLPTITIPNSTLVLLTLTVITDLLITPLPSNPLFNSRITALLNNIVVNAHSTTALLPISIMKTIVMLTHMFILSVLIIRFHSTRPHIQRSNNSNIIRTSADPHRCKVRCSLQAKWHM